MWCTLSRFSFDVILWPEIPVSQQQLQKSPSQCFICKNCIYLCIFARQFYYLSGCVELALTLHEQWREFALLLRKVPQHVLCIILRSRKREIRECSWTLLWRRRARSLLVFFISWIKRRIFMREIIFLCVHFKISIKLAAKRRRWMSFFLTFFQEKSSLNKLVCAHTCAWESVNEDCSLHMCCGTSQRECVKRGKEEEANVICMPKKEKNI